MILLSLFLSLLQTIQSTVEREITNTSGWAFFCVCVGVSVNFGVCECTEQHAHVLLISLSSNIIKVDDSNFIIYYIDYRL